MTDQSNTTSSSPDPSASPGSTPSPRSCRGRRGIFVIALLAVAVVAGLTGNMLSTAFGQGFAWHAWHDGPVALPGPAPGAAPRRFGPVILLVVIAYGCDGAGFVPHTIFWVDYVARVLGLGAVWGSLSWLGFGLGAMVGPVAVGALADRLGLGRTLVLAFLVKGLAI